MLRNGRARILFATISHRVGRWWLSLNVEAADLHDACRHSDPINNAVMRAGGLAYTVVLRR